ncbi:MAG: hypothetical protein NT007_09150 [Candidatus Kapabacteria bacterium]|nr:hypothetical protein [Candidatus Kapabacteria bacterium]
MDKFNKIDELLDGKLDVSYEDELFSKLFTDEEYKLEFKRQIAIKSAVRADMRAYLPNPETTFGLYSKLGLNTTGLFQNLGANQITKAHGFYANIIKYSQGLKGAFIATLATALIMFFLLKPNLSDSLNNSNKLSNKNSQENTSNLNVNSVASQNLNNFVPKADKQQVKIIYRTVYVEKKSTANISENRTENNAIEPVQLITETSQAIEKNTFSKEPFNIKKADILINNNQLPTKNQQIEKFASNLPDQRIETKNIRIYGLSLELFGSQYFYTQKVNVAPKIILPLNNWGLLVSYNFYDNFSIGADIRSETFYQKYIGTEGFATYMYEQQPSFYTYSLNLKYDLKEYIGFNNLSPNIQASAGANTAGFVGRAKLGVTYTPYPPLSFLIGLDYSYFDYFHSMSRFSTIKYGSYFGVSYNY